jgi:hypothetical protein
MGATRQPFPPEIHQYCRGAYESGIFKSIEELYKHCKKQWKRAPSLPALRNWAAEEEWNKHASDEEVKEKTRKNYAELLADLGYDQKKKAQLITEGLAAFSDFGQKVIDLIDSADIELPDNIKEALRKMAPDLAVRLKYLQEANKLTDEYPTEKRKIQAEIKDTGSGTKKRYTDMTEDELAKELERMRSKR